MIKKNTILLALMATLAIAALSQEGGLPPALLALINTERAFAKLSTEQGWQNAFIHYFADEGVNFLPHPVKTRENLRQRPPQPRPLTSTLNWAPIYGAVARAGDLGYSTGPVLISDNTASRRPPQHSLFFSIWKRQADGQWRVVADMGAPLPAVFAPLDATFQAAPQHKGKVPHRAPSNEAARAELLEVEQEFFSQSQADATAAWQKYLSEDARIYRPQMMPIIGKDALGQWATKQANLRGEPLKVDVSSSNDLGYAYGRYEMNAAARSETGYYLRAWRRAEQGRWHIVHDVANPVPEGKKP